MWVQLGGPPAGDERGERPTHLSLLALASNLDFNSKKVLRLSSSAPDIAWRWELLFRRSDN